MGGNLAVLVNAYACSPNMGSEPGMGWIWVSNLAKYCKLHIITEEEFRAQIEATLLTLPQGKNMHFHFIPVTPEVRQMCWNQGDWRFYWFYRKWQKKALELARKICSEEKIDIIHQLNMVGFREPGFLWKIENIPFIWGPIGGMNMVPLQYINSASAKKKIKFWLKNLISKLQYSYHPRVQKIIRRADVLIAANKASYDVLTKLHPEKEIVLINETGSSDNGVIPQKVADKKEFNILWVGRFIPTKLLKFSLDVINEIKDLPGLKFHIVGQAFSEEETDFYHKIASEMNLDSICLWHGWISHEEVQKLMQDSDIFFFPSVVEGTPHVVLESIANGLPIICFDICGQAEVVNETVGRKIPLSTPAESLVLFAKTIKSLYEDRSLLASLSAGCGNRKKQLSWEKKFEEVETIYRKISNC